ncbi:hypothetical protein [uncultured Desulfuromonas sp.]|uniref:hypothetical protein n=1 Tax=uncultured Desulfuromonas sp. TaxID=181013 RepID=UPI002AAC1750|nr:hypothetical protein [uncultured Desulfuromonas sp.]
MIVKSKPVSCFFMQVFLILCVVALLSGCGGGGSSSSSGSSSTPSSSDQDTTETPTPDSPADSDADMDETVVIERNVDFLADYLSELQTGSPEYEYGYYASRTILNPNLFVYLQADKLAINDLQNLDGSLELLQTSHDDLDPFYIYSLTSDDSFTWSDVDLTNREIVSARDIYPEEYPYLELFDDRMQTATLTLRASTITELELVELL